MVTHGNMVFTAGSLSEYLRLRPEERILNVLPLAFDYGLYQLFMAIRMGATLVLERSFVYPAQVLKRMEEEEVTVFPGVPTVYATLVGMHEREPLRFDSVERVTNTAAALPPSFHDPLREIFPNALIFRMYGLTECKRVSYLEPELLDEKPTSVGKAIPGTETLVLDEQGKRVAPGETGVLHVRGPHVMVGYWNLPDRTAEMLVEGPVPGRAHALHPRPLHDRRGGLPLLRGPKRRHHQVARREGQPRGGRGRAVRHLGRARGGRDRRARRAPRRGGARVCRRSTRARSSASATSSAPAASGSRASWSPHGSTSSTSCRRRRAGRSARRASQETAAAVEP